MPTIELRQPILDETSARIPLTSGFVATVDFQSLPLVEGFNWYAHKSKGHWYARNEIWDSVAKKKIRRFMHRVVMAESGDMLIDHRDGDGLNNKLGNLRACPNIDNSRNRNRVSGSSSQFKGVTFSKRDGIWIAQITANYKHIWLGSFKTEAEAAVAYNEAAKEWFGAFARLNNVVLGNER